MSVEMVLEKRKKQTKWMVFVVFGRRVLMEWGGDRWRMVGGEGRRVFGVGWGLESVEGGVTSVEDGVKEGERGSVADRRMRRGIGRRWRADREKGKRECGSVGDGGGVGYFRWRLGGRPRVVRWEMGAKMERRIGGVRWVLVGGMVIGKANCEVTYVRLVDFIGEGEGVRRCKRWWCGFGVDRAEERREIGGGLIGGRKGWSVEWENRVREEEREKGIEGKREMDRC